MDLFRPFFALYKPFKVLFWLDIGCAVLSGLLEIGFPLAVRAYIDLLLPMRDMTMIVLGAVALLLIYLTNAGLLTIITYWGHKLGMSIETRMRATVFSHVQRLSWRWFSQQKTGSLISRLTRDLEEIGEIAHHGPEDISIAIMTLTGAFIAMLYIHLPLALVALTIIPITGFVVVFFGNRMVESWRRILGELGDLSSRIAEVVSGIRVIQAFTNERYEEELFETRNRQFSSKRLNAYRYLSASISLNYFGLRAAQVVIMMVGAWFVYAGSLSIGSFVAFLLLVSIFISPFDRIATFLEMLPKGVAAFRRYLDLLAIDPEVADRVGAVKAPEFAGWVRYSNVIFGYTADRVALKGLSFDVPPGQTVAFVGPSGAGKTTALALLPRFYEPWSGVITIDGLQVKDLTLSSLRAQIGLVNQDVFLFDGTIRDNIAYGRPGASDDDILQAAQKAQLAALIESLPEGLDTRVEEKGVTLSGGQRQRVAIARVFLKDPPILILDEATSALDTQTEREVQHVLSTLMRDRTTLVIAHRLSTVRLADRIVVLDRGEIVEAGTYEELVRQEGLFAAMDALA